MLDTLHMTQFKCHITCKNDLALMLAKIAGEAAVAPPDATASMSISEKCFITSAGPAALTMMLWTKFSAVNCLYVFSDTKLYQSVKLR